MYVRKYIPKLYHCEQRQEWTLSFGWSLRNHTRFMLRKLYLWRNLNTGLRGSDMIKQFFKRRYSESSFQKVLLYPKHTEPNKVKTRINHYSWHFIYLILWCQYKPKCFKVNQKLYCFPKVSQPGSANGIMVINVSDSAHAPFLAISHICSQTHTYMF